MYLKEVEHEVYSDRVMWLTGV